MGVQEIGARFVVLGRTEFLTAMREAKAQVDSLNKSLVSGAAKAKAAGSPLAAFAQSYALYTKQMAADTERQLNRVATVGKVAFYGLGAAAVLVGYQSVKAFSQFQSSMERVSTQAGVAQARIGALSKGVLSMSSSVGQGPTALADALYRIASSNAGLHATNQQLLQMTKYASQLTVLGGSGTNLADTARVFGGIRASGIKGASNPADIAAWANAVVGAGDLKMEDLVNFFGTGVLPAGSLAGISLQQLGPVLALMGDNLISGQVAGHSLTHALSLIGAPSGVSAKAFGAVGLDPLALGRMMQTQGLIPAIGMLRQSLMGPLSGTANTAQLRAYGISPADIARAQQVGFGAMGSSGAADVMEILTRAFGGAKQAVPIDTMVVEYNRLLAKQREVSRQSNRKTYLQDLAHQENTLAFQTQRFTKSLGALETAIGGGLQPVVKGFMRYGADFLGFLSKNTDLALGLGGAITAVLAPAMGLYLYRSLTKVRGAIVDVVHGYAKLVRMILAQVIPSLRVEDTALGTTISEEELAARGAGFGFLGFLGGAAAAGTASYVLSSALSSHFDTGNSNYGAATARAQIAALSSSPLVAQAQSIEAKIAADKKRMAAMSNQSGVSDLFSGSAWLSAITFGAEGKEADYNRLVGEVKQYQQQLAHIQAQAAADNINLTVNLDGKTIAKSTVKNVRRQVARQ